MATANKIDVEEFPVRMIGLRSLRDDHFIQSRVKTDVAHARGITDFVLKNGPINEPIIVFDDGVEPYWTSDGIHRIIGYREAARVNPRFKQIRAEIRPGTKRDAIVYAASANQEKTYLKRSAADIRNAVFLLLEDEQWRLSTNSAIKSHVGIGSNMTTKRYVNEFYEKNPNLAPSDRKWLRGSPGPRKYRDTESRTGFRYTTTVKGKTIHLGSDPSEAESKFAEAKQMVESRISVYKKTSNIYSYLSINEIAFHSIVKNLTNLFRCIYGVEVRGVAVTWAAFEEFGDAVKAIGRAVCCREMIGAARAVVLCPVEYGPPEVLDLGRKAGIEFMTIEDFVASLKPEGEPPCPNQS